VPFFTVEEARVVTMFFEQGADAVKMFELGAVKRFVAQVRQTR
jgi:hypothetical protein